MNKYYQEAEIEKIANKIWHGNYPKQNVVKYCDTTDVGIDYRTDWIGIGPDWEVVSRKLEMKIEKCDIGIGRIYVRKIQK